MTFGSLDEAMFWKDAFLVYAGRYPYDTQRCSDLADLAVMSYRDRAEKVWDPLGSPE